MPFKISDMYVGKVEDQLSQQTAESLRKAIKSRKDSVEVDGQLEIRQHDDPDNYLIKPFGVVMNVKVSIAVLALLLLFFIILVITGE